MIVFGVLAIVLVASGVFVIAAQKPVYSIIGLLVNFFALAIMYLRLSGEFLAMIQILVYSGAILMLFVFVIALLSSGVRPFELGPDRMPRAAGAGVIVGALGLALLIYGVSRSPMVMPPAVPVPTSVPGPAGYPNVFGSVADFGRALFTVHLLPFEVTAFVLMVAIIGVVLLAGDHEPLRPIGRARQQALERREREAILREGR